MTHGLLGFVGRQAELSTLRDALEVAHGGRGGTWLLTGDAGIGKSRLVEEAAGEAARAGFRVLWGRCWEAGGAPAFWPWIQILRDLLWTADAASFAGSRGVHVAQLVPELRERLPDLPETPPAAGDSAQFMLLDSVAGVLCAEARQRPLFLALEDLHVASPSSLLLLDFVAQHVRGAPILVLGTFRHGEGAGEAERLLQRLAQTAHTLPLAPLGREDIGAFLGRATGREPNGRLLDTVVERTEGNPLFLVELCRLMVARGSSEASSDIVPPTLRAALQRRVAALSSAARDVLEHAAVVGRDFTLAQLVGAFGRRAEEVRRALDEAEQLAIVAPSGDGHRFTHILLREALHQDLPIAHRQQQHLQVARWFETYSVESTGIPWSEIAHHYLEAGEHGRERAIDASERAAQQADETLAFDEAIASYRAALQAVDLAPVRDPRRRAELMIGLGHAQLHRGDLATGRDTCLAAAALARELRAPELLARAALELGSVLTFAKVDPMLVGLLEEALRVLGPEHDRLRARAMSRLAAAKQPAADSRVPVELALRAIEVARATGDERTLLATLSCASSAMIDNRGADERMPIDREHVMLATALDDKVEQLRGQVRLALGSFELGDLTGAHAAVEAVRTLAARACHPFFTWRSAALEATVALWEGRFAEAERWITRARTLGVEAGDPNVHAAVTFQTARLARLTGRRDELRASLVRISQLFAGTPIAEGLARLFAAAQGLQLAPAAAAPSTAELELAPSDRASFESAAELLAATGDRAIAEALLARLAHDRSACVTSGVVGLTWDGPLARVRALLEWTLGRIDDAITSMTAATERCRQLGGRPMLAWTSQELAALHLERGRGDDRARARELVDEAAAIASELDMPFVLARLDADRASLARSDAPRPTTPTMAFTITASGELWVIAREGRSFQLRDSKGLRFLARLVGEPRRDFHVLDLADAFVDPGDAGEILDPRARQAYRERVRALDEELADAEQRNDLGAIARAREELEALQAQLSNAVGLGGRSRRAGASAERARINVQRRVRSAIAQIAAHDAVLARHLERSVRTGVYCCYEPE